MKEDIRIAISSALETLALEGGDFVVDYPTDKNADADFFSNVAMVVAKQAGQPPRHIAEQLITLLQSRIKGVKTVSVAGPGFLNFTLSREEFTQTLDTILSNGHDWGRNTTHRGEVVLVEYTSPNLFKPLHIGNLVGNIIGESLTRLFEYSGAEVKRINYPSDIGLTVAKAVWGLKKTQADPTDIAALGEAYRQGSESYETDEVAKSEIVEINQALYAQTNTELNTLRDQGIRTSKMQLDEICKKLGTVFDTAIFESEAAPKGVEIVKSHIGDIFVESDGAVVYEGDKVGLHTRVFLNSKGLPTYEAKDLGNFSIKQSTYPDWHTSIIVTGNEQTEYFKVLYAAINDIFPDTKTKSLEHIPTGFLTLTTGKMSSRKGNVLTGESLLRDMEESAREKAAQTRTDNVDELTQMVAVAALKYQILRSAVGSNMVFDKEKALSFEGDSGPYLQYTFARIQSALEKAKEVGVVLATKLPPPTPYEVEKLVTQFQTVVETALRERAPHKIIGYLTELAGAFNSFYAVEKIADVNDVYAPYKVAVAQAVAITLKNGLWLLGIKAPERM
jgi:arginyl-tRNA synthetase